MFFILYSPRIFRLRVRTAPPRVTLRRGRPERWPQRKTPDAFGPEFSCRDLVRRSGSEVALSANVERDRVLVLELIESRSACGAAGVERSGTREPLVETRAHHFTRERQVLDRRPAGDRTHLVDGVVRVAAEVRRVGAVSLLLRCTGAQNWLLPWSGRGRTAVVHPRSAAEQAGRPVRIPVVVERAAETVGLRQLRSPVPPKAVGR